MMNSNYFLKDKLQSIFTKFPFLSIRYQYAVNEQTHIVEVLPFTEFDNNLEYQKQEAELTFEFDNLFFPESLMFVSENSLTKITEPEFELSPYLFQELTAQQMNYQEFVGLETSEFLCGNYNLALAA